MMRKRRFALLALLFWALMVVWLWKREGWNKTSIPHPVASVKLNPKAGTMGIYFQGQRIGEAKESLQPTESGYQIDEHARFTLTLMGEERAVETKMVLRTAQDLSLESFDYTLSSSGIEFRAIGKRLDKTLRVRLETQGTSPEIEIPLPEAPYLSPSLKFLLAQKNLSAGETHSFPLFDPLTQRIEPVTVRVEGREEIEVQGKKTSATRVSGSFKGIPLTLWLDQEGVVREQGPLGLTLERESGPPRPPVGGKANLDLISVAAVVPDRPIPNPIQRSLLTLSLSGFPLEDFALTSGRQTLTKGVLSIRKEVMKHSSAGKTLPISDAALRPYLASTPFMQSDHPRITSLASTIVAGETRVDRAATKIKNWVYTNVRKEPTISLPSALEVLDSRRGDCNEHAVLFGALARAAGIPARTVVGLTYLKNAFYYHAWSEVWMDDWISIDSTLDQFPADVTHIRLIEGEIDRQMDILKLLGRIRIGVIEP